MYSAVILATIFIKCFCNSSERTNPTSLVTTMKYVSVSITTFIPNKERFKNQLKDPHSITGQQFNSSLQTEKLSLYKLQLKTKILNKKSANIHDINKISKESDSLEQEVHKAKVSGRHLKHKTNRNKSKKNYKINDSTYESDESLGYKKTSQSSKTTKINKKPVRRKIEIELDSNYDSLSEKESADFESNEIKLQLKEGEELLDFSALAKMKTFTISNNSDYSSHSKKNLGSKENPFFNLNCTSFSLEEEQNISTGYVDERITRLIEKADDYPEGGTQLLEDMHKYYCYLKHVNTLVENKVKRGKTLMKKLVEEDPAFTQIRFDTDELTDYFSWVEEEKEAFENMMDAMCYQWKCLVARHSH